MTDTQQTTTPATAAGPTRLERIAPWIAGVLLALPVLIARYPPMTDLPLHEGLVGILRYFHDTSRFPPGLYAENFGQPNQLFHTAAWALSYVVATDTACKLLVAASVIAIPVCAARFAAHVGANRLVAVVIAPVALGWMFSWGLVANMMGLAAFLAILPNLDRFAAKPTWSGALGALGGAVLLYFAHFAMIIIYAGASLWLAACHPFRVRTTLTRIAPFVACIAIVAGQLRYQEQFKSPTLNALPTMYVSVATKLRQVPGIIVPAYDEITRWAFFALCVVAVVLFLTLRNRERAEPVPRDVQPFMFRYRFELFAAACFVAYLAFPLTLNGATLVYQRFFPPAFVVFVVVTAPASLASRSARVMRLLVPAMPAAALLMAWPSFADSHQTYKDLDVILAHMEKGSAVAMLDLGASPTRTFSVSPGPSRYLATGGGRMHYAFTDSSIAPAILRPEYQWNEALRRISASSWEFSPSHDLKHFRYVIVHSVDASLQIIVAEAMKPEARAIASAGEWVLLESTLPVVPLLSKEEPLPSPAPPSLRRRFKMELDILTRENTDDPSSAGSGQSSGEPPVPSP